MYEIQGLKCYLSWKVLNNQPQNGEYTGLLLLLLFINFFFFFFFFVVGCIREVGHTVPQARLRPWKLIGHKTHSLWRRACFLVQMARRHAPERQDQGGYPPERVKCQLAWLSQGLKSYALARWLNIATEWWMAISCMTLTVLWHVSRLPSNRPGLASTTASFPQQQSQNTQHPEPGQWINQINPDNRTILLPVTISF